MPQLTNQPKAPPTTEAVQLPKAAASVFSNNTEAALQDAPPSDSGNERTNTRVPLSLSSVFEPQQIKSTAGNRVVLPSVLFSNTSGAVDAAQKVNLSPVERCASEWRKVAGSNPAASPQGRRVAQAGRAAQSRDVRSNRTPVPTTNGLAQRQSAGLFFDQIQARGIARFQQDLGVQSFDFAFEILEAFKEAA